MSRLLTANTAAAYSFRQRMYWFLHCIGFFTAAPVILPRQRNITFSSLLLFFQFHLEPSPPQPFPATSMLLFVLPVVPVVVVVVSPSMMQRGGRRRSGVTIGRRGRRRWGPGVSSSHSAATRLRRSLTIHLRLHLSLYTYGRNLQRVQYTNVGLQNYVDWKQSFIEITSEIISALIAAKS
jgi:hypothetical protein